MRRAIVTAAVIGWTAASAFGQPKPAATPTTKPSATTQDVNAGPRASGVDVAIVSAKPEYLILHRKNAAGEVEELVTNQLVVVVRLKVTNTGKADVAYNSFNGAADKRDDKASLALSNRTFTALANFGGDAEPVGITRTATIKPGESVTDLLAFAPPPKGVTATTLFLPSKNHGGVGLWKLPITIEDAPKED